MKREIICNSCAEELKKMPSAVGEFKKFVPGKAKEHCQCDECNTPIQNNDDCVAFSLWTNDSPYYNWENEFVNII